ncbi:PAS domain S-box-containing protein [Pedobacter westerhofensis]|uniref:histidine kinase n=1 Tax=Pedobacter westerhofensis TaxID=425512 RepID=A0A521FVK6_9SPHI|nr:GAF domain-containing protein [Pedobacter westerhofensis]SMO99601.1 PAS domain S-box-containing protein [Pedobacter westerhofensis]
MPYKELERQLAVNRFLNLRFSKENELHEVLEMVAKICGKQRAIITFVDEDTPQVNYKYWFGCETIAYEDSFCDLIVKDSEVIIIPDAVLDYRFKNSPLIVCDPLARFYAGVPLITFDGITIGSICVIDKSPGILTENQLEILKVFAKQVVHLIDFDASLKAVKDLYIEAKRSEIELRSFFESSVDHHLLLGRNFEILTFNKSWESHVMNTYGLQMERGKKMIEYINSEHLPDFFRDYCTAMKGTAVFDQRNLRQDNKDRWCMVKFEPAYNSHGEIIGVSVNVVDVNKKVEQERSLQLKDQQLDEIAIFQSHELRRPVASILGFMEVFKANNYSASAEELMLLEKTAQELDSKIRKLVKSSQIKQ